MRTLSQGMRGPDVDKWQEFLAKLGLLSKPGSAWFDAALDAATRRFQTEQDLEVDGVVGKKTMAAAGRLGFRTLRRLTNSEVTAAISAAASRIIRQHYRDPFGTEIPFVADGTDFVARIEEHYHPPGGPIKPWGHHPGVSVFAVVGGAAVDVVHDTEPLPNPDDPAFGGVANVATVDVPRFHLSKTSQERLVGVHVDLVKLVQRAIQITNIDFTVLEGLRSMERQRQLVAQGRSQTLNSRHLTGHAVDLGPLVNGLVVWDWPVYHRLAEIVKSAAADLSIPIEWGGDWKSFPDGPHWQLPWAKYPAR